MSKQASEFQEKAMALLYRGKEIFKPLNTGYIDQRVSCVREFIANIFFYTKNGVTIMIDMFLQTLIQSRGIIKKYAFAV